MCVYIYIYIHTIYIYTSEEAIMGCCESRVILNTVVEVNATPILPALPDQNLHSQMEKFTHTRNAQSALKFKQLTP